MCAFYLKHKVLFGSSLSQITKVAQLGVKFARKGTNLNFKKNVQLFIDIEVLIQVQVICICINSSPVKKASL